MKNKLPLTPVRLLICAIAYIATTIFTPSAAVAATSNNVYSTPYLGKFTSAEVVEQDWTVIDANNDGITWELDDDKMMTINTGKAHCISDDWLISPLIRIDSEMYLNTYYKTGDDIERMEIYVITGDIEDYESGDMVVSTKRVESFNNINYFTVDVSDYVGEDIRVAYHCVSDYYGEKLSAVELTVTQSEDAVVVSCQTSGAGYATLNGIKSNAIEIPYDSDCTIEVFPEDGGSIKSFYSPTLDTYVDGSSVTLKNVKNGIEYIVTFTSTLNITDSRTEEASTEYDIVNLYHEDESTKNFVWKIGNKDIVVDELNIDIESDGSTPEISVGKKGSLTANNLNVHLNAREGEWNLIAIPYDITIEDIEINGNPTIYGEDILVRIYKGEKRAANSVEGTSATGWEDQTSGEILKNEGFALAIDGEAGVEQRVTFTSGKEVIIDKDDKTILLERHECEVNNGGDADWNLKGNPHHSTHTKGTGYVLYLYDRANNSYDEYSEVEDVDIKPYTGWFVQSDDDFTELTFSIGSSVDKDVEQINGSITLTINSNEDKAKMFIADGASMEYLRNEDAVHFAPLNNNLSQIYYIDQSGCEIASTVIPELTESTKVAYKATQSGTQSITITTNIDNRAIYLQDNTTGGKTLMTDGTTYEFESSVGVFNNRFELLTEAETTGITTSTATPSTIKIITTKGAIIINGAELGESVQIVSSNGTQIYHGKITSPNQTITTPSRGVVIVNIAGEVFKCIL